MTDAELLSAVRDLVARGHHRDEVPGLPGVGMDDPEIPPGRHRRLFFRGSEEFTAAEAAGLLDRLPDPPPPADAAALAEAVTLVGAPLPPLLRGLYAVANGGFGPGYGLLGLRDGHPDDTGRTAVDLLVEAARGTRWSGMPQGLIPLCHWGSAIYSLVHCPSGRIYGWDPNGAADDIPFFEQEYTLSTWLEAWLASTLHQPWLMEDPVTGELRGATIEETRAEFEQAFD